MISLVANSVALEMPDQRIPLNFQGTDATDVANLFVSFTNSFFIPHSDVNDRALENAHQIFSDSLMPYRIIEAALLINGRDIFGASRLVLLESDNAGWRASFYAASAGVTLAGSIQSLNLGTMEYSITGITTKVLNEYPQLVNTSPFNHGFMRRVIDGEINWNLARPFVYVASIIQYLLTEGRIELFIDPAVEEFKRVVLPMTDLKKIDLQHSGYSFKAERISTAQTLTLTGTNVICIFNDVTSGNESAGYSDSTGKFRIAYESKVNVKVNLKINVQSTTGAVRIFYIMANETKQLARVELNPDSIAEYAVSLSVDSSSIWTKVIGGADDGFMTLHVGYTGPGGGGAADQLRTDSSFEVTVSDEAIAGNTIDIAKSLPDMARADLIKEFLMLFNGITYYKNGRLVVTGFKALPMVMRDWSRKVDTESPRTVITSGSPLGRSSIFKYENDNDAPTNFGGAKVAINNQNLPASVTYHSSKFAASIDTVVLGLNVMSIPIWESSLSTGPGDATHSGGSGNFNITLSQWPDQLAEMGDYIRIPSIGRDFLILSTTPGSPGTIAVAGPTVIPNFSSKPYEIYKLSKIKIKPRFGLVSVANHSASIKYRLNNSTATVTSFKEITFSYLDWSNLLSQYYRLWLGSMEKYKMVRLFVQLDESDVMEFDTTTCISIEGQGQFYCQALNKYVGDGEPTEAELIALKSPIESTKITAL